MDAVVDVPQPAGARPRGPVTAPPLDDNRAMPTLTFIESGDRRTTLDVPEGWSLMQAATINGVESILGQCGGACACATCHCYVDDQLAAVLPPPAENELMMLESVVAERRPNSRLACQLKASAAMDGATLEVPEAQE